MSLGCFFCYSSHPPIVVKKEVLYVRERVNSLKKRASKIKNKGKVKKNLLETQETSYDISWVLVVVVVNICIVYVRVMDGINTEVC